MLLCTRCTSDGSTRNLDDANRFSVPLCCCTRRRGVSAARVRAIATRTPPPGSDFGIQHDRIATDAPIRIGCRVVVRCDRLMMVNANCAMAPQTCAVCA